MSSPVKPSTISNQSGAYQYKGGITSASQNYIDNEFPNLLDKNNGDTITGLVTVASGGEILFANGSTLQLDATSNVNIISANVVLSGSALITFGNGTGLEFELGSVLLTLLGSNIDVFGNITIENGANLNVLSGGQINVETGSELLIESGGTFQTNATSIVNLNGTITVNTVDITWSSAVVAPTLGQSATTGSGTTISILGQNSSGTGQNAGSVSIIGGNATGSSTTTGGNVTMYAGTGNTNGMVGLGINGSNLMALGPGFGLGFLAPASVIVAGSNITLSDAVITSPFISISGALSASINIKFNNLPTGQGAVFFVNANSVGNGGSFTITLSYNGTNAGNVLTPASSGKTSCIVIIDQSGNIAVILGG